MEIHHLSTRYRVPTGFITGWVEIRLVTLLADHINEMPSNETMAMTRSHGEWGMDHMPRVAEAATSYATSVAAEDNNRVPSLLQSDDTNGSPENATGFLAVVLVKGLIISYVVWWVLKQMMLAMSVWPVKAWVGSLSKVHSSYAILVGEGLLLNAFFCEIYYVMPLCPFHWFSVNSVPKFHLSEIDVVSFLYSFMTYFSHIQNTKGNCIACE